MAVSTVTVTSLPLRKELLNPGLAEVAAVVVLSGRAATWSRTVAPGAEASVLLLAIFKSVILAELVKSCSLILTEEAPSMLPVSTSGASDSDCLRTYYCGGETTTCRTLAAVGK